MQEQTISCRKEEKRKHSKHRMEGETVDIAFGLIPLPDLQATDSRANH